ncbi:hypothetical protein PLUTE_b0863 [Pseudoalteromonas luteoviolacea DSM 6061]|nr:hypothetical protein [Pseudoalteromonas luteoviolacea DSM 6061]
MDCSVYSIKLFDSNDSFNQFYLILSSLYLCIQAKQLRLLKKITYF